MVSKMAIEGKTYTSNNVKLLKHMDRLTAIQQKKLARPILLHISPINACNLTCSFCCFANRDLTDRLSLEQMKECVSQFKELGLLSVEFTGGGEPTLHPQFNEIVEYCHSIGLGVGLCTNGARLNKVENWDHFSWVRLGMYGFYEGYQYDLKALRDKDVAISAAYVWDEAWESSENPNVTGLWQSPKKKRKTRVLQDRSAFFEMLTWVEKEKIPTRIAFNAIKDIVLVKQDIERIREQLKEYESIRGTLKYAFLSDFNFKGDRRNDHCYMHLVKPFLFTDGNVYACPSAELSVENHFNVNEEFKVCSWDTVNEVYIRMAKEGLGFQRHHSCRFCKYAMQNELIDDIMTPTIHNEFA